MDPRFSTKRAVTLLIVFFLVLAAGPAPVVAQSMGAGPAFTGAAGTIVIDEGETTNQISGVAGTILIRGTVNGDVSALAGDIVIAETGTVNGDVSVATGSLRIAGTVTGSVSAGAGSVLVEPAGSIGGDFSIGAGNADIAGNIQGDATIGADTITIAETANIAGGLRYDGHLTRHPAKNVQGEVVLDENLGGFSPVNWGGPTLRFPPWADTVYGFVANLLLGAILLLLFPGFSRRVAERVGDEPARSGAIGALFLIGVPIALVLIAITIIGIPVALLGAAVYGLTVWVGVVYGEYSVGHWLLGRRSEDVNRWYALLLGLLVFAVLGLIPILGDLLVLAALLVGLGAMAALLYGGYRKRRGREPSPTTATTGDGTDASAA